MKLDELSAAATQGEWYTDTENSEGEYGTGPDTHSGFLVSVIYGPDGKSLFDPHNSDCIEVHEDYPDEDGYVSAWDETSRRNAAFIVALVNAYRTGQLVPREAVEGAVEALERIEAQAVCVALPASPEERCDWLVNIAHIARAALASLKPESHHG